MTRTRRSSLTARRARSEEHTSELQSPCNLVCRLLLEKKNTDQHNRLPMTSRATVPSCTTISPPPFPDSEPFPSLRFSPCCPSLPVPSAQRLVRPPRLY